MPIDQITQAKELLQRSSIKTMRKDLKRLREMDVARESKKIMTGGSSQEVRKQQDFLFRKQAEETKLQTQKLQQEKDRAALEQKRLEQERQKAAAKLQPAKDETQERWKLERNLQTIERRQAEVKAKMAQPVSSPVPAPPKPTIPSPVPPKPAVPAPKPTETERRRKFMEDVERWAASH